jgi:hypothetical protein
MFHLCGNATKVLSLPKMIFCPEYDHQIVLCLLPFWLKKLRSYRSYDQNLVCD